MKPVVVLTTVGGGFDAHTLANELVDRRLAACVNILPQVYSVYRWQGAVENDTEQLLLIKTSDERVEALRQALFERHPYEVPEFVVLEMDGVAQAYRQWLMDSVTLHTE